jgi:ATP-dependent HslUV protease subunit HslV
MSNGLHRKADRHLAESCCFMLHNTESQKPRWRSTTVLAVRHKGHMVIGADGQVTYGNTIMKADTRKLRRMLDGRIIVGFAGSTADAFALMERFEEKVKDFPGNIARAATELARDWRTDRILRRLEAMMVVADAELTLLLTGQGDVVQPTDGVVGIGSGGPFATAAAKSLVRHSNLTAEEIVRESLQIASEIDIYTNNNIIIEELTCQN